MQFCAKQVFPLAGSTERDNLFPAQLWPKLGQMGLLGITAPEEHGGLGKGYFDHLLVMEAISHASRSIGLSYGAQ